ncbi:tail fiber domain-containing protein [Chryseobacterium polytrichastri]|uniref:Por secretion system C-terminal sorting domain-containing protein n=1 Tax=Chryseobacterium polytrichastri TaxID=1302687 RepID=A0A1M6VVU6_9FLAO|nr:tail fiber domain-containing protein [Chryseobacterium polytrichastri]SHK85593.1 Por secretion system C-terminal sorting domain-containing protein [Chryseobacterium polytrichastri]
MKTSNKLPKILRKTKKLQLVAGIVLSLTFSNSLHAQNASYSVNSIPIGGSLNAAFGVGALPSVSGLANVANGYLSMNANTSGSYNTAAGAYSLNRNVSGNYNAAFGYQALLGTMSVNNTAIGFRSLYLNTTGTDNSANGFAALYTNATGTFNTGLGSGADVASNALTNATAIGAGAIVNTSNKVRIGNATVTVVEGPVAYTFSDGRFKNNVKEEDVKGLSFISQLRPVVYNLDTNKITEFWSKNLSEEARAVSMNQNFTNANNIRHSGFIAQEVVEAAKKANYNFNGIHTPENENDNYSLAYSEFVVPLVKGMQEQQKMIENLQQQVNDLQKKLESKFTNNQSVLVSSMEQNVPNPFSRETEIKYNIVGQFRSAHIVIYDLSGKQIKTVPIKQAGASSVIITSDQLVAGLYMYSIWVDGKLIDSKRMVVTN